MLQPRVAGLATLVLALSFEIPVHAQERPGGGSFPVSSGEPGPAHSVVLAAFDPVINDLGLDRVAAERVRKLRAEFTQAMQTAFEKAGLRIVPQPPGLPPDELDAKLREIREKRDPIMTKLNDDYLPQLKKLLTEPQWERLQQIHFQFRWNRSVSDPELDEQLDLTQQDLLKIDAVRREYAGRLEELNAAARADSGRRPDPRQVQELTKERNAKVLEVLSGEQRGKYALLTGKPFDTAQLVAPIFGARGSLRVGSPLAAIRMGPGYLAALAAAGPVMQELALDAETASRIEDLFAQFARDLRSGNEQAGLVPAEFQKVGTLPQEEREARFQEISDKRDELLEKLNLRYAPQVQEILSAQQFARLQQIQWQILGIEALKDASLAKILGLTDDQRRRIATTIREHGRLLRALPEKRIGGRGVGVDPQQFRELMRARESKTLEILTEEQRANLVSLKGKPFDTEQLLRAASGQVGGAAQRPAARGVPEKNE